MVTAVLLGGGRLAGGRGSVAGTLLALLMISIIDNGLSLANVTPYAGQVFHAALLLLALVIDRPSGARGTNPATPARATVSTCRRDPSDDTRSPPIQIVPCLPRPG